MHSRLDPALKSTRFFFSEAKGTNTTHYSFVIENHCISSATEPDWCHINVDLFWVAFLHTTLPLLLFYYFCCRCFPLRNNSLIYISIFPPLSPPQSCHSSCADVTELGRGGGFFFLSFFFLPWLDVWRSRRGAVFTWQPQFSPVSGGTLRNNKWVHDPQ